MNKFNFPTRLTDVNSFKASPKKVAITIMCMFQNLIAVIQASMVRKHFFELRNVGKYVLKNKLKIRMKHIQT